MSYTRDREQFIVTVTRYGLPYYIAVTLLRIATTINRLAELSCSSEAADRDRIPCPATGKPGRTTYPCLCDAPETGHTTIPRIALQAYRAEQRAIAAMPEGWQVLTEGDPRGYTLRVIPPEYAERNAGRDRFNLDTIGVPSRESGIRW
jgi:hypothetical protein